MGGGGLPGRVVGAGQEVAALRLLGGQRVEPRVGSRPDRRAQREAIKQRRAAAAQELQQWRAWKQARAVTDGSEEALPARSRARETITRRVSRTALGDARR